MPTARAPGKIIISGEHSVVYGAPALVCAVNRYVKVSLPLNSLQESDSRMPLQKLLFQQKAKIESSIPIGSGMGSSAALAVAMSALICKEKYWKLNRKDICDQAYEWEKAQHGKPSGVDNTISTFGGLLWYRKESETMKILKRLKPTRSLPSFCVIQTGKPEESTKEMVELVSKRFENKKDERQSLLNSIESCTKSWLRHLLHEHDSDLGELIKENQRLLVKLGVVSQKTQSLVQKLEDEGIFCKTSGAGGAKNNSGILLALNSDYEKIKQICSYLSLEVFPVKIDVSGVKLYE